MSQRYNSKSWKDLQAQYPTRYTLTHEDQTQEVVTLACNFGTVTESGDVFDKQTMDSMESRIDAGFDTVEDITAGTTDPTGGKNGDIYFKTGTDENDDPVVLGMYVKIAGSWLQVSTGGASLPQAEGGGF